MSVLCICGCIPRLFYQDGINYLGPVVSPLCFCGEVSNRPPRLCPIVYQRLRSLNLLKRQPTRRGKRRCKSRPLTSLGLVNACSVNKRHEAVSAHLLNFKLDLLAITETWQTSNDDSGLKLACPDGYSFIHTPRSGSVGGGVALIFKSTVAVQSVPVLFVPTSFEWLDLFVRIRHKRFRLIVLYRPPTSSKTPPFSVFLSEFTCLLEALNQASGDVVITGDFNIHVGSGETNADDFEEL